MRRVQGIFIALLAVGLASCAARGGSCPRDAAHAAILTAGGEHCFGVDIADTPEEWQRGLMFVQRLDEDRGLLFLFGRVAGQTFWMKNTYISLDIVFIGPDGRIVNIAPRTEPLSEAAISSNMPVAAALEISGGLAGKLGIKPGDIVRHPALSQVGAE